MDAAREQRALELLDLALAAELSPLEWLPFLTRHCPDDPALCEYVLHELQASAEDDELPPALSLPVSDDLIARHPDGLIGQYLSGKYRVDSLLPAQGAMSRVYRGTLLQDDARKAVAIKVLPPDWDPKADSLRFQREWKIQLELSHPCIVNVFDIGWVPDGRPFYVMEWIDDALPLDRYCLTHQLTLEQRLRLFQQVCDAVQYAHSNEIVHRDLKPANILVTPLGTPKLVDFGIAKRATRDVELTKSGTPVGTPKYSSPEAARGRSTTPLTDQYSLGVILFELLTGRLPYSLPEGEDSAYQLAAHYKALLEDDIPAPSAVALRTGPVPPRRLGNDLDNIVLKALERDPKRRYESVAHLRDDIQSLLTNAPVTATRQTRRYRARKFVRRYRGAVATAGLVLFALTLGLVATIMQRNEAVKAQAEAAAANRQVRLQLAVTDFREATVKLQERQPAEALAFLRRALRNWPDLTSARVLALSTLASRSWPLQTFTHDRVRTAAFSPDGTRVLTISGTDAVVTDAAGKIVRNAGDMARLWDARSGEPVGSPIAQDEGNIGRWQFSPSGAQLLTVLSPALVPEVAQVWDTRTGQAIGAPIAVRGLLMSPIFDTDEARVILASVNGTDVTITRREIRSGEVVASDTIHASAGNASARISGIWFSADRSWVLVSVTDGTVQRRDARSGQLLAPPFRVPDLQRIWISPDGTRIWIRGKQPQGIVFNASSGEIVVQLPEGAQSVWFTKDGKRLITTSSTEAQTWDMSSGEPVGDSVRLPNLSVMQLSPDGSRIVAESAGRKVQLWGTHSGEAVGAVLSESDSIAGANFSADGTRLITQSRNSAQIWDARVSAPSGLSVMDVSNTRDALFASDSKIVIASLGPDRHTLLVRAWDTKTAARVGNPLVADADSGSLSRDARHVVAWSDSKAQVWDLETAKPLGPAFPSDGRLGGVRASISPDGLSVLTASDDGITLWDSRSGRPRTLVEHKDTLGSSHRAIFSHDGTRILTVSTTDGKAVAQVWNSSTGEPIGPAVQYEGFVDATGELNRDASLAVAFSKNVALIWNPLSGVIVKRLTHESRVMTGQFSPDGRFLVTDTDDRNAWIWDLASGQRIGPPLKHTDTISDVVISPDGSMVLTASRDEMARLWDMATGQPLGDPISYPRYSRASFSPDGSRLLIASLSDAHIWDVLRCGPDEASTLADLVEAMGGLRVNDEGAAVPIADRNNRLAALRERAKGSPAGQPTVQSFMRWLFDDPWTRTVMPLSTLTVRDRIERLVEDDVTRELAEHDFPGHPLLNDAPSSR